MKKPVSLLSMSALLTACATGPKPAPQVVCPRVPLLELDAPERDWQKEMQNFLRGTLPTQPGLKLPSKSMLTPTKP